MQRNTHRILGTWISGLAESIRDSSVTVISLMPSHFTNILLLSLWFSTTIFSTTGNSATVYDQGLLNFTKEVGTNLAVNRDCITPTVCLTRGSIGPIINGVTGGSAGMRWAKGNIADWPSLNYG